nr:reverse transcriptase domain-containing protein [Tanacetum cinerariifolium]
MDASRPTWPSRESETPESEAPTFAITTRSGVSTQDLPFLASPRLKKQKKDNEVERLLLIFKQIHINLPFLEAMIYMPKGAKVLKDLLLHKVKLEKVASSVKLINHDGKWTEEEEEDSNEENNQLPVVISSALCIVKKARLLEVVPKKVGKTVVKNEKDKLILQQTVTGWRVCIDYHKLNNAIRKDHFPLSFIDQMLQRLAGHEYYRFLDGFLGYFQIPIALEDQKKTTFTCHYGTFTYKRMPFGLCNAPATFQLCMIAIFHELIKDNMEVFMDDFFVFGSSFDHCLNNLEKMLKRCEETNLVLNWEKCHFMVKEGIVLGHKVSGSGIEVDKAKIKAISKLPYPTNVKSIQSFLGHAEFDIEIRDKKGTENIAADHLSRLENLDLGKPTKAEIRDIFPEERLMAISDKNNEPCVLTESYEGSWPKMRQHKFFDNVIADHLEDIMASPPPQEKSLRPGFTGHISSEMNAFPTNDARNVVNFLKRLFARFGIPNALIGDRGTHFYNYQMEKAMKRYGLVYQFSTAYHPQMNGQVVNTNQAIKRILKKTTRNNRKDWSYKLDDALWAFETAFKTPLGTTPFRIIYGKACHLLIKLEHKAYWAIKNCNVDFTKDGENCFLQINEPDEMRLDAYETSISYKGRTRRWNDKRVKEPTNYEKGDKVFLFNLHLRPFLEKLKSRWYELFSMCKEMKNGAIELYDKDGNGFIVNKQRVKPNQKSVLDTNKDDDITLDDEGEDIPIVGWIVVENKRYGELMIDWLGIVETNKVNHIVETDIMKLVIEIKSFGMSSDEFDKETGLFDRLQPKQADRSCVHALSELHLIEIHVVPSKHKDD